MGDLLKFNEECLWAHNDLRKCHNVQPLIYDPSMAIEAEKYANILAERKLLHHSNIEDRLGIGENISQGIKSFVNYVYSGLAVTVHWYSEIKDYDFNLDTQISKRPTNNFTQVVWKESQKAGFGRSKNLINNTWYVVGRYYPTGNVNDKYKENVPALLFNVTWDKLEVVETYLQELKTWEFTNARKHILDSYSCTKTHDKNNKLFLVKEHFKPPDGEAYYESQIFKTDITKEPRPIFVNIRMLPYRDIGTGMNDPDDIESYFENEVLPENPSLNGSEPQEIEDIIRCIVARHNLYRGNYGIEELILDSNLSKYAQHWAQILSDGNFLGFSNYHFKNSNIGENIAMKNEDLTYELGNQLVDSWYNENKFYIYGIKTNNIKEYGLGLLVHYDANMCMYLTKSTIMRWVIEI